MQIALHHVSENFTNVKCSVNHINLHELTQVNGDASIDSGTFSQCTLKLYKHFNLVVVEKQLATTHLRGVINKAKCMNILTHPNIPQLLGVQITRGPYSLIMQYIGENLQSTTVHQLLRNSDTKGSQLHMSEWISVCLDIVEALSHIHSKGYLHT